MSLLPNLEWRYATKKYDSTKKLSDSQVNDLKKAVSLAPSSYGLQPYKVFVISDAELRKELKTASWDQPQITDASHIFVFASRTDLTTEEVDEFIKLTAETRGLKEEDLKGYGDFMKNTISSRTKEDLAAWNARQAYIALGILLSTAAEANIDSTPMEGFDPQKYDEILKLSEKGYQAVVVAAVGYRSSEDDTQHYAKVRKADKDFFVEI